MEIKVIINDLGGELDNGFADLSEVSVYYEREVIFNAINMFKVIEVSWSTRRILFDHQDESRNDEINFWTVKLEYCPIRGML